MLFLLSLVANPMAQFDDIVTDLEVMGGQGVLAIPIIYNGWAQNLPEEWKAQLTEERTDPISLTENSSQANVTAIQ